MNPFKGKYHELLLCTVALLLEFTVAELLLWIMIAELELELICVPLELEAAELLLDTAAGVLELEPVCVPLELEATELLLTIAVPPELDPGVTPPLEEFVCSPLLEESPISGSLPVLPPSPPHEARTNAAVASKAPILNPSRFFVILFVLIVEILFPENIPKIWCFTSCCRSYCSSCYSCGWT